MGYPLSVVRGPHLLLQQTIPGSRGRCPLAAGLGLPHTGDADQQGPLSLPLRSMSRSLTWAWHPPLPLALHEKLGFSEPHRHHHHHTAQYNAHPPSPAQRYQEFPDAGHHQCRPNEAASAIHMRSPHYSHWKKAPARSRSADDYLVVGAWPVVDCPGDPCKQSRSNWLGQCPCRPQATTWELQTSDALLQSKKPWTCPSLRNQTPSPAHQHNPRTPPPSP
mmetsp:Transcript_242/g.483  ORF Transcript_242/g.483 Transcript_242/m.483 type:complete len:220 (+) Transcript_242:73-732(+)